MNSPIRILFFFFLFVLGSQVHLKAQAGDDSTRQKVVVVMTDGTERVGYILSDDGREILLETQTLGKIYILKSSILRITPVVEGKPVEHEEEENFRTQNPFASRYYFTTNSLPLKKGDHYVLTHLYGPEVHFSLNKRFSLGIMTTWIASPMILALKYTFPTKNEKLNFGIGSLIGTSGYLNSFKTNGGLHWGMVTYGDESKNVTFSLGFCHAALGILSENPLIKGTYAADTSQGYAGYPTIPTSNESVNLVYKAPVFGFGGIIQVGKRASIILDGMVFFGQTGNRTVAVPEYDENGILKQVRVVNPKTTMLYLMPGMRFQNTPNKAFQVALAGVTTFTNYGEGRSFPIPMCSWFMKF